MNNKQNTRIFGTLEKINTGYFICDVNGFSHYLGYDVKFENSIGEVVSAVADYRLRPETIEFYGVPADTEEELQDLLNPITDKLPLSQKTLSLTLPQHCYNKR